jgi:hypothetical protein
MATVKSGDEGSSGPPLLLRVWAMGGDWGDLTDEALREEIELVGDLVVAATASPGRMAQDDVDSVLGLCARRELADQ